jgi:hypothetical protein
MLAVICRIIFAAHAITCTDPMSLDDAKRIAATLDQHIPGVGMPIIVRDDDPRWYELAGI